MNKYIVVIFLFISPGCHLLKKNIIYPKQNEFPLVISAELSSDTPAYSFIKTKSKIRFYKDSVVASLYPLLGIELRRLVLTKKHIVIYNKYNNTADSIIFPEDVGIKKITQILIPTKNPDTILYNGNDLSCVFTDYVKKEIIKYRKSVFLPEKIIINKKEVGGKELLKINLQINYKSIQLYYSQR